MIPRLKYAPLARKIRRRHSDHDWNGFLYWMSRAQEFTWACEVRIIFVFSLQGLALTGLIAVLRLSWKKWQARDWFAFTTGMMENLRLWCWDCGWSSVNLIGEVSVSDKNLYETVTVICWCWSAKRFPCNGLTMGRRGIFPFLIFCWNLSIGVSDEFVYFGCLGFEGQNKIEAMKNDRVWAYPAKGALSRPISTPPRIFLMIF